MSVALLNFISTVLSTAGINYEFGQWSSEPAYPYFVGEYNEAEPVNEDGMIQSTFILNGFSRGSWLDLETSKTTIEHLFSNRVQLLPGGSGVGIFYAGAMIVPENDAELKRMQINLVIKEWKVN